MQDKVDKAKAEFEKAKNELDNINSNATEQDKSAAEEKVNKAKAELGKAEFENQKKELQEAPTGAPKFSRSKSLSALGGGRAKPNAVVLSVVEQRRRSTPKDRGGMVARQRNVKRLK